MRALVPLSLMLASCTFPSVTFDDASVPVDSGDDATVVEGGPDAPPGDGGADADPCDKDNDGYKATSCGGNDCNDDDPRVNPGVTQFVTDVPNAFPWGDWNCDGNVEAQYPTVTCAATCQTTEGFLATEGCGSSGEYVTCAGLCVKSDAGTRTQGCR